MSEPTHRRGQAPQPNTDTRSGARSNTVRRIGVPLLSADLADAVALLLLSVIAFSGFNHTFSGSQYLVVALVGVVVGGAVAYAAHLLRQPVIVLIAAGVLLFFVLGGAMALRHAPGGSALPTGHTLSSLGHESINGWKDLLTTLPPVDGAGPLLVLPYMMGLFVGLGGIALATRTRAAFAPVSVVFLAFVAVILLGSRTVDLLSARSAAFLVVALAWGCARYARLRPVVQSGSRRFARLGTAVAALAISAGAAVAIGPHLPGSGSHDRLVLRDHISPPFDLRDYPSPLAEYQRYVQCNTQTQSRNVGAPLFTVSGTFPKGTILRFAALDDYSGTVWQATNDTTARDGVRNAFLKVGPTLDDPAPGKQSTLMITIPNDPTTPSYSDYWMPTAGAIQGISFSGHDATTNARDFRYNFSTRTGVVPGDLGKGDSYTLKVADTVPRVLAATDLVSNGGSLPVVAGTPLDFVSKAAQSLIGTGGEGDVAGAAQILNLGRQLQTKGKLTDCNNDFAYYLAGHYVGRLSEYANGLGSGTPGANPPFLGDNEQSAALYALMIEGLGVPARRRRRRRQPRCRRRRPHGHVE